MPHFDPYKLAEMKPEERSAQFQVRSKTCTCDSVVLLTLNYSTCRSPSVNSRQLPNDVMAVEVAINLYSTHWRAASKSFPIGKGSQFVQNFMQSLGSTFVVRHSGGNLSSFIQILPVRFPDLRYFVPKLCNALSYRRLDSLCASRPWGWAPAHST